MIMMTMSLEPGIPDIYRLALDSEPWASKDAFFGDHIHCIWYYSFYFYPASFSRLYSCGVIDLRTLRS